MDIFIQREDTETDRYRQVEEGRDAQCTKVCSLKDNKESNSEKRRWQSASGKTKWTEGDAREEARTKSVWMLFLPFSEVIF